MLKRLAPAPLLTILLCSGSLAAEMPELPNPLEHVRPGQYVAYGLTTLMGKVEQRQTVLAVEGEGDDRVFTIKVEFILDDKVVESKEEKVAYKQALADQRKAIAEAEDLRTSSVKTDLEGEEIDAVLVEFTQDGKACKLYLSDKVPLVGMIRMEIEGLDEPIMELLDFAD